MTQLEFNFQSDFTDAEQQRWFEYAVIMERETMYEATPKTVVVPQEPKGTKGDLKRGLGGVKPQLSQIPGGALAWAARAAQYGGQKYERGNYLRPTVDKLADLDRLSSYIDATMRHLFAVTGEIEWQRGNTSMEGTDLLVGGYLDNESGLPHLAHALISLMFAIQQGINAGILVEDPGTPWVK
jgi:hypothetical protein